MKPSRIGTHARSGTGHTSGGNARCCVIENLGILDYTTALKMQISARETLQKDLDSLDRVFFVEHPPVYTLGKRGGRENLMVSEEFLNERGIRVVQTERGGNITYHGPGQAVLYPIVNLSRARIGVADFVYGLEQIMKNTAAEFEVQADRDSRNHGLWVDQKKIGSVGLSIKQGISIHGLAMNITVDLTPFSWINPCGLENVCMTSIQQQLENKNPRVTGSSLPDLSMARVMTAFVTYFCKLFNYTPVEGAL